MQQGVVRSTEPGVTGSIQPALLLLEKTPFLIETLLRDLPEDLLRWKPAADRLVDCGSAGSSGGY